MRRTAAWKPIAGVAAATVAIAGFGVAPATAAPGDPSQALAEVLRAQLIEGDLAGAGLAYASTPGGPASQTDDIDVELLGGDIQIVSGGLQLPIITDGTTPGLLDLGQAGVLSSYASTPSATSAVAASGLITDDGAIAFDADEEPPTASTASVDLTALLSQLSIDGLTDQIVDELGLQVGAVASRVEIVDGAPVAEYRVADLGLQVSSELVGTLGTSLREGIADLNAPLQTTIGGLGSTVTSTLDLIDVSVAGLADVSLGGGTVSVTLADLDATLDTVLGANAILISDDESVTVNLTDGTITVDLAQIVNGDGVGLNDFGPNTEILTPETIQAITSGISNALGKIVAPVTAAVEGLLDDSTVTVTIPVTASLDTGLPLVGTIPVIGGNLTVSGTLTQLAGGTGTIGNTLAVLPGLPIGSGLVTPLISGLLDGLTSQVVNPLLQDLNPAVDAVLVTTSDQIEDALQAVVTEVTDALSPVLSAVVDQVASITINAQPTLDTPPAPSDLGAAGFTVRAIEVTLLPDLAGSSLASIALASSSIQLVEAADAGTLVVDPDRAHPGDTVDLSGEGWDPDGGDVVVTFRDANGVQVGATVTLPTTDGTIAGEYTVPTTAVPGDLIATAVQGEASTTDDLEVVAAPVIIVDPDPVDPGETITITGSGFLCGPVTVTILDGTTVLATIPNVAVAADGSWSTTYLVPADVDTTTLTIRAEGQGTCDEDGETPVDVDLPESLDLTPGEVRVGDDVAIAGDGWDAGTVTVTFSNAGGQVGTSVPVTVGADGVLAGTFEVPTGTAAGALTGTAVQGDDTEQDAVTVFGDATVAVDPTSIRAGGTVDVTGTGWLPSGGDVVVTFTDADDAVVGTVTIDEEDIAADGSIADDFTVPGGTDPGALTVTAVQGDVEAGASLTVLPEPSVTVSPSTVRPLDQVAVGGSGWGPGTVTVVFTDEDDQQVGAPLVLTPTAGVISGSFTVPDGTAPGTLTATATQGTDTDTAELEVVLAPTVTATPPRVHDGDSVAIGGSGWGTAPVTVTITDGTTVIGTPITLAPVDGVITGSYPIPEGTDPADLTVTATDGTDTATTVVEVVADAVVDADPDPADPGDIVTITGTGFLCGPVDVVITSGATTLATFTNVAVVDDEWTQVWTVPAGIAVDSVTITATTAATAPCDDDGGTELEIDLPETLAATPATVQRGGTVTVTGTGWSDGLVSIVARSANNAIVGSFTATSADASFSQPFVVPAGTPLGSLTFTAVQGDATETASVTVVQLPTGPATLIASPSIVEPGDDVAIDGLQWDPTGPAVTVTITDEDGAVLASFPAAVLPDGRLVTASYTVPSTIDAPQTLTATGVQGSRSASDTIGVREAELPVIRLWGPDRMATSVEISRDAYPFGASTVYLANADSFADALSAAPAAALESAPLLLTPTGTLSASTAEELDRLDPTTIVIVGGPAAISPSVQTAASQYGPTVRVGGTNRLETSLLITQRAFTSSDVAYIATAENFPDALTAGAAAGAEEAPLLLTTGATPSAALLDTLDDLGVAGVRIVGGTSAVAGSQDAAFEAAGIEVLDRYDGVNRLDTGVLVGQDNFDGDLPRVYVASAQNYPDALAGSAVAGAQGVPVYVTPTDCIYGPILDEVERLGDAQIVLLGGPVALTDNVFDLVECTP